MDVTYATRVFRNAPWTSEICDLSCRYGEQMKLTTVKWLHLIPVGARCLWFSHKAHKSVRLRLLRVHIGGPAKWVGVLDFQILILTVCKIAEPNMDSHTGNAIISPWLLTTTKGHSRARLWLLLMACDSEGSETHTACSICSRPCSLRSLGFVPG